MLRQRNLVLGHSSDKSECLVVCKGFGVRGSNLTSVGCRDEVLDMQLILLGLSFFICILRIIIPIIVRIKGAL